MENKLKILEIDNSTLDQYVSNSKTWTEVYKNISNKSTSCIKWFIKKQILKHGIDINHLNKKKTSNKISLDTILISESDYLHMSDLKYRLYAVL